MWIFDSMEVGALNPVLFKGRLYNGPSRCYCSWGLASFFRLDLKRGGMVLNLEEW